MEGKKRVVRYNIIKIKLPDLAKNSFFCLAVSGFAAGVPNEVQSKPNTASPHHSHGFNQVLNSFLFAESSSEENL